ncbi:MAG TPA: VCBS repeat-containing protein [Solirubrobacterales bacterium]|nr:VCBS repeat-containing protein [Solirubrobacterales bacterium]
MMRTVRPGVAFALLLIGFVLAPSAAYAVLGDFTEPASSPVPVGKTGSSVAAGDFDNDGDNDLAVGYSAGVAVLTNNGKGDFSATGTSPETVQGGPASIVAGKFNTDAHLDLVVGSETDEVDDGRVTVLLGDGKGDFTAGSPVSLKGAARDVAAADVDDDEDLDVVVGEFFPAQVAILRNDGSGSLAAPLFEDAGGSGTNIFSIATGDFSGDGEEDIVVGNPFTHEVSVYVNDGEEDGDFTEGTPVTGVDGYSLATGFFDAGGALDVAVATESAAAVILLGNGSGGLSKAASSPEALPGPSHAIASADFNADGKTDLAAVGNNTPGYAAILLGAGDGDFAPAPSSPESVGSWPTAIAAAPLDKNTSTDLAIANIFGDKANILLNDFSASPPVENPPQQPPVVTPPATVPPEQKVFKCPKNKQLKKGKCVLKKCPKGKKLKKNGRCVKKKKPPARSRRG